MSIDKFKFVSPGVFIDEIDRSFLPREAEAMGPVVIGRSLRGPVMRPVKVKSFSDFVEVFGEPIPGGAGGDVWRDGNKTAPTYGAYAAQAYLRNSSPLTYVRLAGYQHPKLDSGAPTAYAGWKTDNAYGLFVMPISQSATNPEVYVTDGAVTASLAAVIYANGTNYGLKGTPLSGAAGNEIANYSLNTWVRAVGPNLEFKISVNGSEKVVNFDENSKKYIRSALNTNPILTNSSITNPSLNYFLGETFKTWVEENSNGSVTSDKFAACLVKLHGTQKDFADHRVEAQDAATGWIVSQHKGAFSEFTGSASTNEYPVQKLFRLVGLTEGEWNSQNLKISIEDIKESTNRFSDWGTFTLSIRSMEDTDLTPKYIERFTSLSLDPFSDNYIAKKIGDKYTEWDYNKKTFVEYGRYNNKSKFIRVEMNEEVDAALTPQDLLPFGFYAPAIFTASLQTTVSGAAGYTVPAHSFIHSALTGNSPWTASFALAQIPTLDTSNDSPGKVFRSTYFGFKTNVADSKKFNYDVVDYVRPLQKDAEPVYSSFLFSLDDLSGSVVSGAINPSVPVTWKLNNRSSGVSMTAMQYTASNGSRMVLTELNRFTVPMVGGCDGVNITEKDPFNRRVLGDESDTSINTEYKNYAINSIKVAIESIADPEVVEMNLATMPGIEHELLTSKLIDVCETRADSLAIIDLKGDYIPEEGKKDTNVKASDRKPIVENAVTNLKNRALNSSYGCAFFPWVLAKDTINNNTVWVPSSVAALGTFSSSQNKTQLWFAPAGFNRGGLTDGAAGIPVVQTSLRLSSRDRDELYSVNINPIATFPNEGVVVFGQKTLQVVPSALDRINVRRLMIYVKKEISRMARLVLFDPNIEVTWKSFTNQVEPFLQNVKANFGLDDFKVVLDKSTTTPDLVDRNIVYAKIFLKPTRAIEFIALDFIITNSGASFED